MPRCWRRRSKSTGRYSTRSSRREKPRASPGAFSGDADATWIDNLSLVIGFWIVSLLLRLIIGLTEQIPARASSWKHVLSGLVVVGILDWLIRTELIWLAIGFALIGGAIYLIVSVFRSPRHQPSTTKEARAKTPAENPSTTQDPKPASAGAGSGTNWFAIIVAAILVAALKGQIQQPANKGGNAQPKQVNVQTASATERFWNGQIVRLAKLEQTFPEPSADETYGDFIRTAEEFLNRPLIYPLFLVGDGNERGVGEVLVG